MNRCYNAAYFGIMSINNFMMNHGPTVEFFVRLASFTSFLILIFINYPRIKARIRHILRKRK